MEFIRQRNFDRMHYRAAIRVLWLNMKKDAVAIGEKRQKLRDQGHEVGSILTDTRTVKEILSDDKK